MNEGAETLCQKLTVGEKPNFWGKPGAQGSFSATHRLNEVRLLWLEDPSAQEQSLEPATSASMYAISDQERTKTAHAPARGTRARTHACTLRPPPPRAALESRVVEALVA